MYTALLIQLHQNVSTMFAVKLFQCHHLYDLQKWLYIELPDLICKLLPFATWQTAHLWTSTSLFDFHPIAAETLNAHQNLLLHIHIAYNMSNPITIGHLGTLILSVLHLHSLRCWPLLFVLCFSLLPTSSNLYHHDVYWRWFLLQCQSHI